MIYKKENNQMKIFTFTPKTYSIIIYKYVVVRPTSLVNLFWISYLGITLQSFSVDVCTKFCLFKQAFEHWLCIDCRLLVGALHERSSLVMIEHNDQSTFLSVTSPTKQYISLQHWKVQLRFLSESSHMIIFE